MSIVLPALIGFVTGFVIARLERFFTKTKFILPAEKGVMVSTRSESDTQFINFVTPKERFEKSSSIGDIIE